MQRHLEAENKRQKGCGRMDEYTDPLTPEDIARRLIASEQMLHLRHQAWEAKIKELRAALDAVAKEILSPLAGRTRAQYNLEVWSERLPDYPDWHGVALRRSRCDYLWRIRASSPFGQYYSNAAAIAPEALSGSVPPGQVVIQFRSHYGTKAWSHEVAPHQGSFVLAEKTNTGAEIFPRLTARTVALRIWEDVVRSVMNQSLTGD
jgi:hypothetical protein